MNIQDAVCIMVNRTFHKDYNLMRRSSWRVGCYLVIPKNSDFLTNHTKYKDGTSFTDLSTGPNISIWDILADDWEVMKGKD